MKKLDEVLNEINNSTDIHEIDNLILELMVVRKALLQRKKELVMLNIVDNVCNKVELSSK